ncbi:hypothetical protein AWB99_10780 [Mycolicibacterium confluentis]|nr:hypothetical protein AWB99_10780 [Mycolicibacterium confluentis]
MRAFGILEMFIDDGGQGLTSAQIVEHTGLPRTTVHELLATMVATKYLRRDNANGIYQLGINAFRLGFAFADQFDLLKVGQRVTERVAARCNETVNFGVLDDDSIVYLCKVDSTFAVHTISKVGGRLPASCTAIGKVLLAALDDTELAKMLTRESLVSLTPNSITDPAEIMAQIRMIRQRGVAFEFGESNPDVTCVAAPVRDHRGKLIAALSVSVPYIRWKQRPEQEWVDLVTTGAREIGLELGSPS